MRAVLFGVRRRVLRWGVTIVYLGGTWVGFGQAKDEMSNQQQSAFCIFGSL